jgi:hypothetical protein
MGLSRLIGTTLHPPVPRGLYEECKRQFLGDILEIKLKYNIPAELILNSDWQENNACSWLKVCSNQGPYRLAKYYFEFCDISLWRIIANPNNI